jgi:hypothetical protein
LRKRVPPKAIVQHELNAISRLECICSH